MPIVKLGKMPGMKMSNVVNPLSEQPSGVPVDAPIPPDLANPEPDEDDMVDLD